METRSFCRDGAWGSKAIQEVLVNGRVVSLQFGVVALVGVFLVDLLDDDPFVRGLASVVPIDFQGIVKHTATVLSALLEVLKHLKLGQPVCAHALLALVSLRDPQSLTIAKVSGHCILSELVEPLEQLLSFLLLLARGMHQKRLPLQFDRLGLSKVLDGHVLGLEHHADKVVELVA